MGRSPKWRDEGTIQNTKMIIKYILTLLVVMVFQVSHSQTELEFYRNFDHVNIGNKHSIDWRVQNASSIGLKIRIPYKMVMIGGVASFSTYDLHRPQNYYTMEMSKFALLISRSIQLHKNLDFLIEIYPYGRHFNSDFFSASMVIDKLNFGLGSFVGLRYSLLQKFKVGVGHSIEKDILRSAIDSSEIMDKNRFINMMINSFSINVVYNFGKRDNE